MIVRDLWLSHHDEMLLVDSRALIVSLEVEQIVPESTMRWAKCRRGIDSQIEIFCVISLWSWTARVLHHKCHLAAAAGQRTSGIKRFDLISGHSEVVRVPPLCAPIGQPLHSTGGLRIAGATARAPTKVLGLRATKLSARPNIDQPLIAANRHFGRVQRKGQTTTTTS